jgi:hypothetical protein
MRNAQGYASITSPEGVREADTFTCYHCNRITHVRAYADPAELGGLCKACMRLICSKCVGKNCIPFEKKLDLMEAKYHARRSYV